jgi:hypothetical protein
LMSCNESGKIPVLTPQNILYKLHFSRFTGSFSLRSKIAL